MNRTITIPVRYLVTIAFIALATMVTLAAATQTIENRFDWAMIPSVGTVWLMAYLVPIMLKRVEPN
jgi:peptidoglycan/LPS O-acetylase OafA/YrhL